MADTLKTVTGTINSVSGIKKSIKGDQFIRLKIDNDWFTMWKPSEDFVISIGDKVKYSYVLQGDFKNLKSLELIRDKDIKKSISKDNMSAEFMEASDIDPSKRIDDDLKEIKYKLSLILEILRRKFDLDIE